MVSERIDLGVARDRLAERLGEKAMAHCISVAETAAALASAYGVDVDDAYLAGLLHDWAREESAERLLSSAGELGLEVTDIDAAVPYLLHARVGAHQLRDAFPGLGADVVEAVAAHTLGEVEMSDLARVVYIADLIEPTRAFDGVEDLRHAMGEVSLDELFASAYAASMAHLLRLRRHLHPRTVAVWNAIVDRGGE